MAQSELSEVADFYRDRCIFITGATGFMGKVLVEKLLRCCSNVKTVYLLLRPKEGHDSRHRLSDLLNAQIFDGIKKEQPHVLTKLVPIHGDLMLPQLGINQSDMTLLANTVSIVFHSAATVKFDEPLRLSVELNVIGTRRLVDLCHKMVHLEALVHVSTAYCNCDREDIDEVIYSAPVAPQKIIDATEWMNSELMTALTPHLIKGRPNTYTFTKALAESLLIEECGNLPVAIVRPSIVTAAWKEPIPGWVDNLNGPTGLLVASTKGMLQTLHCHCNGVADLIPVDVVINLMIAVAWNTATHKANNILVYHCTSGTTNKITWGKLQRIALPYIIQNPSAEVFQYPGGTFKNSFLLNNICVMLYHHIPAYLADAAALIIGRKPKMVKLYQKLHRAIQSLNYFTTHEWKFHCNNQFMLMERMSEKDKKAFNFDIKHLDWSSYWRDYVLGARQFILKEEASSLPVARKKLRKAYLFSQLINLMFIVIAWRLLMIRSKAARSLWYYCLSLVIRLYQLLPLLSSL